MEVLFSHTGWNTLHCSLVCIRTLDFLGVQDRDLPRRGLDGRILRWLIHRVRSQRQLPPREASPIRRLLIIKQAPSLIPHPFILLVDLLLCLPVRFEPLWVRVLVDVELVVQIWLWVPRESLGVLQRIY